MSSVGTPAPLSPLAPRVPPGAPATPASATDAPLPITYEGVPPEAIGANGVKELIKVAEEPVTTTVGMELMEGFRKELEAVVADVKKIEGVARSNYRVAKQLQHIVGLTQKVLSLMEESM